MFGAFALITISLWFFDYIKNQTKNIQVAQAPNNLVNNVSSQKLAIDLLNQIYTTPISYVTNDERSILIDLTNMNLFLLKSGQIYKTIPVLHKGPNTLWFQSPTNYFNIGVKYKLLKSGIVNVYMPYSVQIHQDFFVHGIPYLPSGEKVTSQYSGGCLRVADEDAKIVYDFAKRNDKIFIFETAVKDENIKPGFYNPVDANHYWIKQAFNSPLKINNQYLQHAGIDMATKEPENVKAIYDGQIENIIMVGDNDFGFGNTIIIKHQFNDQILYSLYAHLEAINKDILIGQKVNGGTILGKTGASGYGCQNYWRIGKDGCQESDYLDRHLHLEIKNKPTLTNGEGSNDCLQKNGQLGTCFGYVPKNPLMYGYINPLTFLTK